MTQEKGKKMSYRDQYITVGALKTRYVCAGEQGKDLVFIHGFGTSLEIWEKNIGELSKRHRVWAFDIPGFGYSDLNGFPDYLPTMTQFLKGFLDTLKIEKATLAGLSLGGAISMKFAIDYPRSVENLILVDSGGLGTDLPLSMRIASLPYLGELLTRPSKKMVRAFLTPLVYDPALLDEAWLDFYAEIYARPGFHASFMRALRAICNLSGPRIELLNQIRSRINEITAPTLILWGRQDASFPPDHAYFARDRIANSRIHLFEECGHMPNFEKPDEFNRVILEFLSGE
ncbi:MAG TPA: alpha/beta fold hydrolase [Deltaproteobacteria bacterium]|nr:alpha/beta fold hydrolase [Deltaproteobacteria bacterium]HPR53710.1 alpha/beta fold hydrolase [Deltaproteobacteria bacterium]HXK47576.1 alpha/beta fold hydrolase [Deltaproteobacteria bacterium]